MKKAFAALTLIMLSLLAFAGVAGATTLDALDSYMETVRFYEMRAAEDAPSGITDAGVESINGATGTVTYTRDEITLPGKGGMDFTVRRRFDGNQELYKQTIVRRKGALDLASLSDYERECEMYVFKYLNPEGETVFVVFDTPEQMRQTENGTGTIRVSADYMSKRTYLQNYSYGGDRYYQYYFRDTANMGLAFRTYYLYAPENLGNDIVLTRDKTVGMSVIGIEAVGAYVYTSDSGDSMQWEYDEPYLEYRAQVIENGVSTTFVYQDIDGDGKIAVDANGNKIEGDVECIDTGTFYDPEMGTMMEFSIYYEAYDHAEALYNKQEDGPDITAGEIWGEVYIYSESENGYVKKLSKMYEIVPEQSSVGSDLMITILRYDGMEYKYRIDDEYTPASRIRTKGSLNFSKNCHFEEQKDKYGNVITCTKTSSGYDYVDTLGRTIQLRYTYIKVNGSVVMKYVYDTIANDDAFDPYNVFAFDAKETMQAQNMLSGKNVTYTMAYTTNAYVMGEAGENHNPHRITLSNDSIRMDSVQLPTGASIHYDYTVTEGLRIDIDKAVRAPITKIRERITGKYVKENANAAPTQRQAFAYAQLDQTDRKFITTYPDAEGVSRSQTFDVYGNITEDIQQSTQAGNSYYIQTVNTYQDRRDGKRLLGTQTVTTKASADAEDGNTVTTEYAYNDYRLPTTIIRDGEVVRYRVYFSGMTNLLKEDFTLQSDGKWVGVVNESSDSLNITKTTYTTRNGAPDAANAASDMVETFTYTTEGDLKTHTKGGTTTTYTYAYADYTTDKAWATNYITTSVSGVTGLTDANGDVKAKASTLTTKTVIDRYGRTTSQKDALGNTTEIAYDYNATANTYTNTVTYADDATETTVMDFAANSVVATDADGVKIKTVFNALGQESALYQYTNGAWVKAYDVTYDNMGRVSAKIVYADGTNETSRITYAYYADGQLASETVMQGATVLTKKEYAYTPYAGENRVATSVKTYSDANTYLALSRYTDKYGYTTEDILSDGTNTYTQSYQMDKAGNLTAYRDFNANAAGLASWTETYTYDLKNRLLSTTNAAGTTSSTYNLLDQVATTKDAKGTITRFNYNKAGMLTEQYVDVDGGARVKYYYDANGNNTRTDTYTGATSFRTAQNVYDSRNRVIAAKIGDQITKYTYTPGGRTTSFALGFKSVTAEADEHTQITSYTYDALGRLFSTTDPMGNSESYTYDNLNQLVSKTDRNGAVTTYTYDGLGRTLSLTAAQEGKETESVQYSYDYTGNVTQMIDSSGIVMYNYDVRGLLLSETKGDIVKTYTYDANGNRTSFVAPSINVNTSYTYDSLGRMLTVRDEAFGTISYVYDANSNITAINGGSKGVRMSYDTQNRLISKSIGAGTNYTLSYYNDGNVKRVTDSGGTINYTYNETGALASGDGATYAYDKYGNRSEMTKDGSTYRYYYDKNNRLIREADFAGNTASAYRYDNNGNLIERMHQPETTEPTQTLSESLTVVSAPNFTTDTFTFDVLGRMSSANVNGTTTTYTYDGNGLRQTKNNKSFIYDGANIVWEGESPTTGTTYYRGLELIARKAPETNRVFYYSDWHGNIEGYDYDDFGNPTGGNALNPFRYNGEYYDEETGFIYLRARYYDPGVGRFVSEDPYWNLDNMIYGDRESKQTTITETALKRQQVIKQSIDNIFLQQGMTSAEKITEAIRWTMGNLTEEERQQVENVVAGNRHVSLVSILQSGNLYNYGINNPISCVDPSGEIAITAGTAMVTVMALIAIAPITYYTIKSLVDTLCNTQIRYNRTIFYEAYISNGQVKTGKALTIPQAIVRVSLGGSVYSVDKTAAYMLAKIASGGKEPVHDNAHGSDSGYKSHYHLANRSKGVHIWYY